MNDTTHYAVFFHPQALEALGVAIQPYLCEGAAGKYALCREVDTSGPLFEMVVEGQDKQGKPMRVDLMVPIGMIRMVVSVKDHPDAFGFGVG